MKELPHAMFVVDTEREKIAVSEAKHNGMPVVALMNSDCDISSVEYPIVGNDASVKSISFFTEKLVEAYKNGLSKAASVEEKKENIESSTSKKKE